MMIKGLTQVIFSPTGATAKVADMICDALSAEHRVIDLSKDADAADLSSGGLVVVAMPVFAGRIPNAAKERLLRCKADGTSAVAIVVYGNRAYGDALLELKDALTSIGCRVIAAAAFVGEHSMLRHVAAGRPDGADRAAARDLAERIEKKIGGAELTTVEVPGDPSYKGKRAMGGIAPKVGGTCDSCCICAASCPVSAIPTDDPKRTGKECIGCMRCVSVCPKKARRLGTVVSFIAGLVLRGAKKNRREPEIFC